MAPSVRRVLKEQQGKGKPRRHPNSLWWLLRSRGCHLCASMCMHVCECMCASYAHECACVHVCTGMCVGTCKYVCVHCTCIFVNGWLWQKLALGGVLQELYRLGCWPASPRDTPVSDFSVLMPSSPTPPPIGSEDGTWVFLLAEHTSFTS